MLAAAPVLAAALVLASAPGAAGAEPDRSVRTYRAVIESATAAFTAGRFDDARAALEAAYAIHPDPVLVFNIASCWRRAGDAAQALAEYHRFLALAPPDDARRPLAIATIASLEQDLRPPKPELSVLTEVRPLPAAALAEVRPPPPAAAPQPSRLRRLWIGLGSLGGLGAITGIVVLVRASAFDGGGPVTTSQPQPDGRDDGGGGPDGGDDRDGRDGQGDGDGDGGDGGGRNLTAPAGPVVPATGERGGAKRRALLLGVSSAALIAASVTVYYFGKRAERRSLRLTVSTSGDGGSLVLGGGF